MDRLIAQVALVSEIPDVSKSELTRTSAAIQKQVMRDVRPLWDVEATVDAFVELEDVPLGYWPVIVLEDIGYDAAGIHLDKDGQPFALVQLSDGWELTASHEVLEMLADPYGNRLIAGNSIKPGQGRVEYLVEICDPPEAEEFAYTVNGIALSDFYTPSYFDPVAASGVRYDFMGAITKPRQVLRGGYISWHEPVTDHWWQCTFFEGTKPVFDDLGVFSRGTDSLRAEIDRRTKTPQRLGEAASARAKGEAILTSRTPAATVARATSSKAESWHAQIEALKTSYAPSGSVGARATGRARASDRAGRPGRGR